MLVSRPYAKGLPIALLSSFMLAESMSAKTLLS